MTVRMLECEGSIEVIITVSNNTWQITMKSKCNDKYVLFVLCLCDNIITNKELDFVDNRQCSD